MGHRPNCCGVFAFILALACSVLLAIGIATSHWRTPGSTSVLSITLEESHGLFQTCITALGVTTCTDIPLGPEDAGLTITVTRAMLLIVVILEFFAIIVGLLGFCSRKHRMSTQGILNIIAALFAIVGCCVYTAMIAIVDQLVSIPPTPEDFGYSFYICWVAAILLFVAGLIGLKGDERTNDVRPAVQQAQMIWSTNTDAGVSVISSQGQERHALVHMR